MSRRNLHRDGDEPLLEQHQQHKSAKFNQQSLNNSNSNNSNTTNEIPQSHASFRMRPRMRRGVGRKNELEDDSGSSNFENRKRRVAAYCTAENYDMEPLLAHLEKHPNREPVLFRDVVHVKDSNWYGFEERIWKFEIQ